MNSGRTRAPGRLGSLYPNIRGIPIGIGYYESVGEIITQTPDRTPQVVAAPEQGTAVRMTAEQKAAGNALFVMGLFACAVGGAWLGKELVFGLRGTA